MRTFSPLILSHAPMLLLFVHALPRISFLFATHGMARSHAPIIFLAQCTQSLLSLPTPWHVPMPLFFVHALCVHPFSSLSIPLLVPMPFIRYISHVLVGDHLWLILQSLATSSFSSTIINKARRARFSVLSDSFLPSNANLPAQPT